MNTLIEKIKGRGARTIFTESSDLRILETAIRLHKEDIVVPVLLGNCAEIISSVAANGWDTEGIRTLDPIEYKNMDTIVTKVIELHKGKLDETQAREACLHRNFSDTMYVRLGCADGPPGGATYSATDIVRPALQLIKTRSGNSIISSCFILIKDGEENLVMGDCSISIDPSADDLVEVTLQTAHTVHQFGIEPRAGLLSYSALGSAKDINVVKANKVATRLKRMSLGFIVEDEVQFGCAVAPEVAKLKVPDSKVTGNINTFIFPNIDTGSTGCEIASRLGGYEAIGSILQGLNIPISDLSRGCSTEEVFKMTIVTAAQECMDI